ncbi:MAG: tRNA glutamyl-Q(34) synthetase GluQRS [Halioglobus sp.]
MPVTTSTYRGRFAPSPTGPLHLGSLIAALASYLDARQNGGRWLLRMEDLDPPREEPGAAQSILQSLQDHGLNWDEEVLWQSSRSTAYQDALQQLHQHHLLFRCDCTRAMLGPDGACNGRCQPNQDRVGSPHALRVAVAKDTTITFEDRLQGRQQEALGEHLPDFVLRRKDALFAYQLAVVVDDAFQGVTHIVRGSDLLESTGRQIYLQQQLGMPRPDYCHIPVITNEQGQKFSKQNHAPALQVSEARANLRQALAFLRQPSPPDSLVSCDAILKFSIEHWSPDALPACRGIAETTI